jgi:hypothetical protein
MTRYYKILQDTVWQLLTFLDTEQLAFLRSTIRLWLVLFVSTVFCPMNKSLHMVTHLLSDSECLETSQKFPLYMWY